MPQDGYSIIQSTATACWRAVKPIFDNPDRKSCAGSAEIPGTGLSVSLGVSRTAAVEQDYREANLTGGFCIVVRMWTLGEEIVLGEPSDRQFFTPGEWGPIVFSVYAHSDDNVWHEISYDGSETIEAIAAKHPESFQELVLDVKQSSHEDRDCYA